MCCMVITTPANYKGVWIASERSLVQYILLKEDCHNLELLVVGNKEHSEFKDILGVKNEKIFIISFS